MAQTTFSGPVRSLAGFVTVGPNSGVSVLTPTAALDASYAGKLIRLGVPVSTLTLPLINASADDGPTTANNLGTIYTFFSEVAATAVVIQTQGADRIVGSVIMQGTTVVGFNANPLTTAKINLNGTTTGGAVGTMFSLQAVAPGKWLLRDANLVAVGAPATPFSA